MRNSTNKVVFSVFCGSPLDDSNHEATLKAFRSVGGIEVQGMYNGKAERSIMLQSTNYSEHMQNLERAQAYAKIYKQESVLEVANDGTAFLHYFTGRSDKIGQWKQLEAGKARPDNYSIVNGTVFVVE